MSADDQTVHLTPVTSWVWTCPACGVEHFQTIADPRGALVMCDGCDRQWHAR